MKTSHIKILTILAIASSAAIATTFLLKPRFDRDLLMLDDVSRLNQIRVGEILRPQSYDELKQAIHRARELGLKASLFSIFGNVLRLLRSRISINRLRSNALLTDNIRSSLDIGFTR